MSLLEKVGLGTVQFGLPYGVTNRGGMPSRAEVRTILQDAETLGVRLIDTAPAYGASEEVLGETWPPRHHFQIVTKTPVYRKPRIAADDAENLRESFMASLGRLKQPAVYGLLMHHAGDLLAADGARLRDAMETLKERQLVQKIGVSVYTGEEIDRVLERFSIDLIQVPLSVVADGLVRSGHLDKLAGRGVEIHVRSVFLQGLLLADPEQLDEAFVRLVPYLRGYHCQRIRQGLSAIQGAVGFVAALPQVQRMVLGVCSHREFREIIDDLAAMPPQAIAGFSGCGCPDEDLVNPSLWKVKR